ncbi:MAG: SCO family protein [Phycisphaerales bacterium]
MNRPSRIGLLCTLSTAVWFAPGVTTNAQVPPPAAVSEEVDFVQNLGAVLPLDAEFVDSTGESITLGDRFGDRPVIIALVYYRCPMMCNLILNGLVDALAKISLEPGVDYELIALSIDHRETPQLAAEKRAVYAERYEPYSAVDGWSFLVGDETGIAEVADAIGYDFVYIEATNQFAHPSGFVITTPDGRVSKYFYGVKYAPFDVRLGLVDASEGAIGSAVDQLLLMCFQYDPTKGKYGLVIMNSIRALGALTLALLGSGIWWMLRRERSTPDPWRAINATGKDGFAR